MTAKAGLAEELHKPARRNYPRRSFLVKDIDETWQADLVQMIPYAKQNKGFKYLLTVIDVFSKYAWTVPIKQKTGKCVTEAMKSILSGKRVPKNLQTDRGKEFYNKDFDQLMKSYNIHLYSTYSNVKASICERFNRTLKSKMWKLFSLRGTHKWLDIIQELTSQYNNSRHRTIGMKPVEVNSDNVKLVLKRINKSKKNLFKRAKFKIGDKVRVSKLKKVFDKGYTPNWSTEVFTITRVSQTKPYTYHLKDYQDKPIAGGFYEEELLKTKYPTVYLVEKVLRKKGKKVYVKWLGFDKTHNSWINKKDM